MRVATSLVLLYFLTTTSVHAQSENPVRFSQHVRPVLSNHCFACHGPDAEHREADLRLDIESNFDSQELLRRITSTDPEITMPPPATGKPLSTKQLQTLQQWIADGAGYENHWAFEPLAALDNSRQERQTQILIDQHVAKRLRAEQLSPSGSADKRSLIRRVTLDLTGLPPTPSQVRSFLSDQSETAYQRVVDRLLASPQFGEHLARYWLDLVRFADTNGLHHDHFRDMSPYRDWVIDAFNQNLPFDDFIKHQLAGDLYEQPTTDQQVASGFNRLHLIIDRGTALPEESFNRNVVDRVTAVGTAFLGLSVQCATCHDHKYDPITQRDFYGLYAFFNNFDGGPETGGRQGTDFKRGLQPPYINLPTAEQSEKLDQFESKLTALAKDIAALQKSGVRNNEPQLKSLIENRKKVQRKRDDLLTTVPAALVMRERKKIRPAHILVRGDYAQPGEQVTRSTPSFLPKMKSKRDVPNRMDLANWLVDPSHPLTARVAVNRFWQQLFGTGIVKTSEDFGAQGESPTHPELLDALSIRFIESGWDVKALMRSIVLSQTYRRSSRVSEQDYNRDPGNRLLARGSRFRLDAEVIRDQLLSVTGLLNNSMHGRSVKPPQPPGLWKLVAMPFSYPREFQPDAGDGVYRRSVYTFWKRGLPPPQMTIFDAPTRESCIARRERTNTPLQALLLMNEQQYFAAARHFAVTLLKQDLTEQQFLATAYETITCQELTPHISNRLNRALSEFDSLYDEDSASAKALVGDDAAANGIAPARLAAWTMIVHSLLNLERTKTRE